MFFSRSLPAFELKALQVDIIYIVESKARGAQPAFSGFFPGQRKKISLRRGLTHAPLSFTENDVMPGRFNASVPSATRTSSVGGLEASERDDQALMPSADFERVLNDGFPGLRFPQWLETLYLQDKAAERLDLVRRGLLLMAVLSLALLLGDCLMVPDQALLAFGLRLLLFMPLALLLFYSLPWLGSQPRELGMMVMSLLAASITLVLCLRSDDDLAATYLVSLSLIQLFNGGVVRMRFWAAVGVDALVLFAFSVAVLALHVISVAVMTSMTMVVVSTTLFTLYGSYWLEHRERKNWLMLQHEQVLFEELHQGNRQLDRIARFDPLTELANRRHFDEYLHQVWSRGRQDGRELALLMVDVDHFKRYNDHYGHPAGDACLKQVAAALKRHLRRPGDLVARLGGEEFMAVLNDTSLSLALAAAERLREQILQLGLAHAASPSAPQVTVSIGVASVRPSMSEDGPGGLMAAADQALYDAKAAGRNRVAAGRVSDGVSA